MRKLLLAAAAAALPALAFGAGTVPTPPRSRAAAAAVPLLYYGGPVLSHAKIIPVFWGPNVDPAVRDGIGAFYRAIADSTYLDWLDADYNTKIKAVDGRQGTNQDIGRGSCGSAITISPRLQGKVLDYKDMQAELADQIDRGALPAPGPDTLYMIHLPAGLGVTYGQYGGSCFTPKVEWCAMHDSFESAKYGHVVYAFMPDADCRECRGGGSAFDSVTESASHELTESITNPIGLFTAGYPGAWTTADNVEIGDQCEASHARLHAPAMTYAVQGEWQNSAKSCKGGEFYSPAPASGDLGETARRFESVRRRVAEGAY
jgi:hypothetical protein